MSEVGILLAEAKVIAADREAASSLDEKNAVTMTRGRVNASLLSAALVKIRQLDHAELRERIALSQAGSKLLRQAGVEAAALLETAENEAAELLEDAAAEARDLLETAESDADDLLRDAISDATDLLEEAEDEAGGW